MSSPVERVRTQGPRASSPIDLLAVGFARREADAVEAIARELLQNVHSIRGVGEAAIDQIKQVTGLDDFEALRCQVLIEIGRRVGGAGKGPPDEITCGADVYELLEHLRHEKREHFYVLLLDTKNVVMRWTPVHIGTLTMSIVGPREVFREAIREGASSIIVAHNHPSGDPDPSPEDLEVTEKLAEIGRLLDIPLLDHVIIGERRYVSLKERKLF